MSKTRGRLTLPSESNFLEETKELMDRWGADAIRDSDGTKLDEATKSLDAKIYTTYFVARGHNDFAKNHMEECQQIYLMSKYTLATSETLEIPFMDGYFEDQIKPDYLHDYKKYWEVIDRTSGEVVPVSDWEVDEERDVVKVINTQPYHEYTVSFLVYAIWDPTQMYNHITNQWGDKPHDIPFDVRYPASHQYMCDYLRQWLKDNPQTDVVRFTTFFYHFTLIFNNLGKEKFVDWFGYGASVSVDALDAFEKEKGYALRPEDIVDQGYYNSTFRVPSQAYLDYIDFIQAFVARQAKELVDIVHDAGKEAMMFLGDNWIGTEPYGPYWKEIGLDAVVGSVGGGATLRMIADIPHLKYTEGRFLPYFFPDTFYEGNNPVIEANENWLLARRALMRNPVDRIGYGGYLSLAYQFPKFVDYIAHVAQEYRDIYDVVKDSSPYVGLKVAFLNSWGKLRTWQTHMVAHALPYKQTYSYFGLLEALSGANVDVSFISFDDILQEGIPEDLDVIINCGDGGTAFSGGDQWTNPRLLAAIRQWVHEGGGFIGVGEPTAVDYQGRYFQLADILGVDKEVGFSLSTDKYFHQPLESHFITSDLPEGETIDFGESMKNIYALSEKTEIIEYSDGEVHLAAHAYGQGRGVYLAGLPYSLSNARLLLRSLYYAASKEDEFFKWNSDHSAVEVHAYPDKNQYAIVNNTPEEQEVTIYDGYGHPQKVILDPSEIRWEFYE